MSLGYPPVARFFSAGLCAAGVGSGFLAYARRKPGSIGTVPSAPNLGVAVNGLGQGVGFAGKEYRDEGWLYQGIHGGTEHSPSGGDDGGTWGRKNFYGKDHG